jgi:riboflavin kinase/FMN adenylyltransferase
MLIYRGLHSTDKKPVALTIGNFDGVHLGHQALLNELRAAAKSRGLKTAVVIFEPHPREFFTPQQAPARLTSLREKLEFFATLSIDRVHICCKDECGGFHTRAWEINCAVRSDWR